MIHLKSFFCILFFSSSSFGSLIYVPSSFQADSARMVVVIHGCLQSAASMALGTGWNRLADGHNLVVLYPQVPPATNPLDCWSWYLPENQRADSGQLKRVMEEIRSTKETLKLKRDDVYLAGISSGAATVAGMLACFPKAFKGGAIHSGPSYGTAKNLLDAQRVLKEGPSPEMAATPCRAQDFSGAVIVVQGKSDVVVNPRNADRVMADFVGGNASSVKPIATAEHSYSVSDYRSQKGNRGRLVMIEGLGHAWSGTKTLPPPPFFATSGPSATDLIWEFFEETSSKK